MTTSLSIHMAGVTKSYRHFQLQDVNIELANGAILGVIGQNGAGKSTILRILMGLVRCESGSVSVLGMPMPRQQRAIKQQLGFVSEDLRLYNSATIGWHMDFVRSLYPTWDAKYAADLLTRFKLKSAQKIKGLSHGQRVKTALLLAIAHRPKLLLLDEPTTGLDPVVRHEVLRELSLILQEHGRSVIFSSHHTQDVEDLADRIAFVHEGRILDNDQKPAYLHRWRRIRFSISPTITLPPSSRSHLLQPHLVDRVDSDLQQLKWVTGHFSNQIVDFLRQKGAKACCVEPMSLEEIFLAQVEMAALKDREDI